MGLTLGSCMAVPLLQHTCCMGWCGREAASLGMPTLGSTVPPGLQNDAEPTSSSLGAPWLRSQWHHPLNGISLWQRIPHPVLLECSEAEMMDLETMPCQLDRCSISKPDGVSLKSLSAQGICKAMTPDRHTFSWCHCSFPIQYLLFLSYQMAYEPFRSLDGRWWL